MVGWKGFAEQMVMDITIAEASGRDATKLPGNAFTYMQWSIIS